MRLLLTRTGSTSMGTFGEIALGHQTIYTVERPWADNQRGSSCVPAGLYRLEPHQSQKYGAVFALVNELLGIYHYPNPKAKRDLILLHSANVADELEGCIAPGMRLGCLRDKWAVVESRTALARVLGYIGTAPNPQLEIVWRTYPGIEAAPHDA